jgi:hypothetical protein
LADFRSLYTPYELKSFSIEYSDISKKGIIRTIGCETCDTDLFTFDNSVLISKNGKGIPLSVLLKEFRKVKYPTISLDKNSNTIVRITY